MYTGSKSTILFQAVSVILALNGLFIYIYIYSGYETTISLSKCLSLYAADSGKALSPISIASLQELNLHEKQTDIIYYKTHKTASTTVGSIIFRFGAQHGLKFHNPHNHYYYIEDADPSSQAHISLFHHVPTDFEYMASHYQEIIPKGKFLSILREPVRRYLSHYHYYNQPINHQFGEFLTWDSYDNYMSKDFGIFNKTDLDNFMVEYYPKFFFLITEKLDEGLLLLKKTWHWSLQDILYITLNDGCASGLRNYDKKPMSCLPKAENLTEAQLSQMRKNNELDSLLYAKALKDFNAKLELQPQSFWDELQLFRKMQQDLEAKCTHTSPIPPACMPYLWMDTEYEAKIGYNGLVANYTRSQVGYPSLM